MQSRMKLGVIFLLLSVLVFSHVTQADQTPEEMATAASQAWLSLVDRSEYIASWNEAAQFFKAAITKEQWRASLRAYRSPLGKVISRELKSRQYTKTLPGAPDGEYVVIQYKTSFEHKQLAIETITPMLDTDGTWRVSGYYIK